MAGVHTYQTKLVWTGNRGTGSSGYRDYDRAHELSAEGVPVILGSSDPAFRGDATRWNPELALLGALSQCHLLSYLHVCVMAGVVVTEYTDVAAATMEQSGIGGRFTEAVLHPHVTVASATMVDKAIALHHDAHRVCFIASSVNFPVRHEPVVTGATTE
ncbi:MAG TPA: OsmC family protein [Pseudonocardiaceae bacterium]|nr:OsmC family protein [Pseudonocardiaceae bacterium]